MRGNVASADPPALRWNKPRTAANRNEARRSRRGAMPDGIAAAAVCAENAGRSSQLETG